MTADVTPSGSELQKKPGLPWGRILLVGSLALNLLLIGGAAGRFFTHGPPRHHTGFGSLQFIPKGFLSELDQPRRTELLSVFKGFRSEFRDGRSRGREQMTRLASALESDPYDPAAVESAVRSFIEGGAELMRHGGDAALAFITKLSPDERKRLARYIRARDAGEHGRAHEAEDDR